MIQKPFDNITKADIEALVENRVRESKTLEYKRELPGTNDDAKKEFLADVSSFANASGGDIIYGISEKRDASGKNTGEPEAVCPITGTSADVVTRRLDDMIRHGIAPRFQYQKREITGWGDDGSGFIILIRIPKSFSSPHMVIYGGASRFYSRSSAGKHQLDVQEIRSAFLATESQAERIKRFREDRIAKILADETPVILTSQHRLVLHVIPVPSFMNRDRIDFGERNHSLSALFPTLNPLLGGGGDSHRFNLDGSLLFYMPTCFSYRQLFWDGTVEIVDSEFVEKRNNAVGVKNATNGTFSSLPLENNVIQAIHQYQKGYYEKNITGPYVISITILGCKGATLGVNRLRINSRENHPIDRNEVIIPEILVEDMSDAPKILQPLFDSVWNACGYSRCLNYDDQGNWNPK